MSDSDIPAYIQPLVRLWESFGAWASLLERDLDELRPVLGRLPALDLSNPRHDKDGARAVIDRHLARHGARPRPIRWFADASSALAHDPIVESLAHPAFPWRGGCPHSFAAAWSAAILARKPDEQSWADFARRTDSKEVAHQRDLAGVPEIKSQATLLELFAAGVYYYWIAADEVGCVARPSFWLLGGQPHRADGPAVEWPTGERYFFWHGNEVARWIIEQPEAITPERVRAEPDGVLRRCMMERYGMARLSLLERWTEWRMCFDHVDLAPLVASGLHHTFAAISERLTAHAESAAARLTPPRLREPQIDKAAVAAAMARFLGEWGKAARPLRWFDDGGSARAYVHEQSSERLRAAYWPRLRLAPAFDAAWYRAGVDPPVGNNVGWLQAMEDWQHWTIDTPRARECNDLDVVTRRCERAEDWIVATRYGAPLEGRPDVSATDIKSLSPSEPLIRRWTPLIDACGAGLFYYWIGPDEVVCIPRPALWIRDGRLHREDGPAVAWASGERYFFWDGVEVPSWVIEQPAQITPDLIRGEANLELRRCMIERFGRERFLREVDPTLLAEDQHGRLWRIDLGGREPYMLLEVENGTREADGSHRRYFLSVPPTMRSPHEAVAWTYGVSANQYRLAVRT